MPIRQGVSGLLALLSGGWAQALALPAQAAPARWTPELAFTVKRVGVVAISPDGRWAAVEVAEPVMEAELSEWRPSVHVYPVGAAGQRAWRVETPASSPAWSPDGRWLAFMSNRSGKRNVWRVGLDGTPAEQLTDVVGELGEFRWSPDGRRLAYLVTDPPAEEELRQVQEKRDARVVGEAYRFARLYRLDLDAAAGRVGQPLTQPHLQVGGHRGAGLSGAAFDWSPDGSAIAFSHSPSPSGDDWVRADVSVVDVATGRVRRLAAAPAAEGGGAGGVWGPAPAVRAAPGGGAAVPSRHPDGTNGVDPVALVRRPRDRGPPDLPGGLPAGVPRAAAHDPTRRPACELHADLHRRCKRVPDRRFCLRRLCGAPPKRARQLGLRPRVPLREPP